VSPGRGGGEVREAKGKTGGSGGKGEERHVGNFLNDRASRVGELLKINHNNPGRKINIWIYLKKKRRGTGKGKKPGMERKDDRGHSRGKSQKAKHQTGGPVYPREDAT